MNNPTPTPGYLDRVEAHLRKAVEKHPHFADSLADDFTLATASFNLRRSRRDITVQKKIGDVLAYSLLNCERNEVFDAINKRDYAHAADECYDAIAVLLRMAFWLDQMAGEKKGESK